MEGAEAAGGAPLKLAAILLLVQIINYGLITFNYRAIASASTRSAIVSDLLFASFNFFVIRQIATGEQSLVAWVGYVVGSGIGTWVGIEISKWWGKRT